MGRKGSTGLTPRQREWLGHLRACGHSGETVRAYAKRHGFSEHGMYQAAKDLRRRGVLTARRRGPATRVASFVRRGALGRGRRRELARLRAHHPRAAPQPAHAGERRQRGAARARPPTGPPRELAITSIPGR